MVLDPQCIWRKIQIEHREIRAKAMSHLSKHKAAYAAQWDREGPNGKPLDSFDTYLQESAKDSAYASPLEIEARARIFDVRVLVIPCLADFEVMAFRASQEKRVLVLALWYEDKHVSLLLPKEGKNYPDSALQISTGPVHPIRAGLGSRLTIPNGHHEADVSSNSYLGRPLKYLTFSPISLITDPIY